MKPSTTVAALLGGHAATAAAQKPWLDQSLPYEERLLSFLAQLNVTQKLAMTSGDTVLEDNGTGVNPCIGHISGNATLGVPSICMGDGPGGVSNGLTNVTTFPAPVLSAATWNSTIQYVYGHAMATEHLGKGRNVVLAPTINILRSPLWGRSAETFSEDPWLTSRFAIAAVQGIQSTGALACPKHFAAYNQETNRFGPLPDYHAVDAVVDERTLRELYLPAFKATVQEADPAAVMCSYNQLNGHYACENDWLLNSTLRQEWGFEGFVLADWYFSARSTVKAVMAGLDINMPGGDLTDLFGLPDYYGKPLLDALNNGSVPMDRLDDMTQRIWRYMFKLGQVDHPVDGNSTAIVQTPEHLDLAQAMVEDGAVLLENKDSALPLSPAKYSKVAVYGRGATKENQVTLNHGGFVKDSSMVVQAPLDHIRSRGEAEGMEVRYAEAYPGNGIFPTIPPSMFKDGHVKATYYNNAQFSGPANTTEFLPNITINTYPGYLWDAWPQEFSVVYEATFLPNTTGGYHFSIVGSGTALLYLDGQLAGNMSYHNFGGNYIQGYAWLEAGTEVELVLKYDTAYSLLTGNYGITLGVSVGGAATRDVEADELAQWADVNIIFANDRISEGMDSGLGLNLPGDQNALITRLAGLSSSSATAAKTIVVLNTNSAVLMPWIDAVDGVLEIWYPGQQVGSALERLLFGDVSPSGHLPVTFPKSLDDAIKIDTNPEAVFHEGLYVGYKAYDAHEIEPLFPFGHGLTYSEFDLGCMTVSTNISSTGAECPDGEEAEALADEFDVLTARAKLRNTGGVRAKQVVQLYVTYPAKAAEPPKLLRAFQKYDLGPGEAVLAELSVKQKDLKVWDEARGKWTLVEGEYVVKLGFSAGDLRTEKAIVL
ncbi:glycoside hydrolase family 3 domain-containing protein [Microdochium trichocladiopsis]|uniref:beta-glucosidase n=1 Tax=Microdochium trichocladiopsis TaxID=1682393 RepID=A0A9P8XZA2_9PEZI|nr:glycoside hydrolase family 3 domain-containing protein [Microdochium trichocladiopsis]KAH7024810.1 glycoside hydrolase family 3 domain-containing protein [Microdochium trichocladiopsis]